MSSKTKCLSLNRFVTRYAVREVYKNGKGETECAILLTTEKSLVSDKEQHKYFAKIGGLINLQDLNTQKIKDLIQELDLFGCYLVLTNYRTFKGPNTYAIVCPHFKGKAPENIVTPLVSFFPRIDGRTGEVICALRISSMDEKTKDRQWTRYVGPKSNSNGFHELHFGYSYDKDYKQKTKSKYVGLYVGKNTSLIMYDIGSVDPKKVVQPEQNRTLVQEGGFVYADADIMFRLCDDSEDQLMSANGLYEKFKDTDKSVLGTNRYKNSHLLRDNKEPKKRSIILFLKSSPLPLPYYLYITDDPSKDPFLKGKRIIVLCIPSGAQLEYIEYWELIDGIKSVENRQSKKPWLKSLQKESDAQNILFEDKINDIPIMSFPTQEKNEKSPQNEDLLKKIKSKRKGNSKESRDKNKSKETKNKSNDIKDENEDKTTAPEVGNDALNKTESLEPNKEKSAEKSSENPTDAAPEGQNKE